MPSSSQTRRERAVRIGSALAGTLFVLIQAWQTRYFLNEDTVSYLDHGDVFFRGDWTNAISSYWGPLYSLLLGAAGQLVQPGPRGEPLLVHAVNFGLFLFALAGFDYFLRTLLAAQPLRDQSWAMRCGVIAIGYAAFAWSCLRLIPQSLSTPDLWVAGLVYFAAGVLVRIRDGRGTAGTFFRLGLILGIAYWVKSVMFVLGGVFLVAAWFSDPGTPGRARRTALAWGTFALLTALLIVPISLRKGSPTIGESGRLTYAWFVNGLSMPPYWQGEEAEFGTPLNPPRLLLDDPRVFEFAAPVGGTYPPWFEAPYWYAGVRVPFDLGRQAGVFVRELRAACRMFLLENGAFLGPLLALWLFAALPWLPNWKTGLRRSFDVCRGQSFLLLPCLTAWLVYASVLVQTRYLAPFLLIPLVAMFAGTAVERTRQRELARCSGCLAVMIWFLLGLEVLQNPFSDADRAEHIRVAEGLWEIGVGEGSELAHVGNSFNAYWARLGRFRIVAEVPRHDAARFWGDAEAELRALQAFATSGVRAVVVAPPRAPGPGWIPIPATRYFVRFLNQRDPSDKDETFVEPPR